MRASARFAPRDERDAPTFGVGKAFSHGPRFAASWIEPALKRVLIIDDDAPLRRTYGRVLSAKFEVTSVASAEQGLEAVAALPPFDAILCDVCLGNGMSGQAFYSRLLEGYARQASRLVFLSGAPADGTRSGAPPHLLKACDLRELLDVVDHIANAA